MANELYDVELSALQSKNALHVAHDIKTASDSAFSGDVLTKTATGFVFGAAYRKPMSGIPKTDLASPVRMSLDKADAAVSEEDFEQFQQSVLREYATLKAGNAENITNGTDYNDLTTPGNFKATSAASAQSMTNCPTNYAHRLSVMTDGLGTAITQIVVTAHDNEIFVRSKYSNNNWTDWNALATSADIEPLDTRLASAESRLASTDAEQKKQNRQLEIHAKALEGLAYTFETDTDEGYSKAVPSGALAVAVNKIGGQTVVRNQMLEDPNFNDNTKWSATRCTATIANNKVVLSNSTGIPIYLFEYFNFKKGHTYLFLIQGRCLNGHIVSLRFQTNNTNSSIYGSAFYLNENWSKYTNILSVPIDTEVGISRFTIRSVDGLEVTEDDFAEFGKAGLVDLTIMFGKGNEPSSTDDYRIKMIERFLDANPSYNNVGELVSADVRSVESRKTDNTLIDSSNIPTALLTFLADKGYGWSAGDIHNEIDFLNKKYIKRVNSVDMGTLSYIRSVEGTDYPHFIASMSDRAYYSGNSALSSPMYEIYPRQATTSTIYENMVGRDKIIYEQATAANIRVLNRTYDNTAALKSAMNGVMLYYELAEPVEYDISSYLTDFDPTLLAEGGGSFTFVQQDDGLELPIPNELKYTVKVADAL